MSEGEREKRLERLAALRAEGIDPYPARSGSRTPIAEVRRLHDGKDAETLASEGSTAAIAGRVRAIRSFGKLVFLKLVENGKLDGGSFYRVVTYDNDRGSPKIEVIQGGPDRSMRERLRPPVPLERTSVTGVRHLDATLSMARGSSADSGRRTRLR